MNTGFVYIEGGCWQGIWFRWGDQGLHYPQKFFKKGLVYIFDLVNARCRAISAVPMPETPKKYGQIAGGKGVFE